MTTINLFFAETCTTVWSRSHSSYCKESTDRFVFNKRKGCLDLDKVLGIGFPKSFTSQLSADVYLQDF